MSAGSLVLKQLDSLLEHVWPANAENDGAELLSHPEASSLQPRLIITHVIPSPSMIVNNDNDNDNDNGNGNDSCQQHQDEPRITELPNEMSWNIDIASPIEILRIMRLCDSQIFCGWHEFPNIYDYVPILVSIIRHTRVILGDTVHNKVVLAGCGTSGRLAFAVARSFNLYLRSIGEHPCFVYCMAGYDKALLTSVEMPEDNPLMGVKDLMDATTDAKAVLYIGITCGLSAPYIGGQLEYAMKQSNFVTVLLGFNPVRIARHRRVEQWGSTTFRDIALKLAALSPTVHGSPSVSRSDSDSDSKTGRHFVLNPVLGPETITGSSRMKSGSATKILLDVIFVIAVYLQFGGNNAGTRTDTENEPKSNLCELVWEMLSEYEHIYRRSYYFKWLPNLAHVCNMAGNALQRKGKIIYYAANEDCTNVMSFIDASEMKPTYGTRLQNYRSYLRNGWRFLNNNEGDLSQLDASGIFQIDVRYFDADAFNENDLIVLIGNINAEQLHFLESKCTAQLVRVAVNLPSHQRNRQSIADQRHVLMDIEVDTHCSSMISNHCPSLLSTFQDGCRMFGMKLLLNAISTAAHVLNGLVLHNRMINVSVANDKLFFRSIGIIQEIGKVDFEIAQQCLLRSIYGSTGTGSECEWQLHENDPISQHLIAATPIYKVVPTAILLAAQISQNNANLKDVQQIRNILNELPSVRLALRQFCSD